jgi:hypothetical protein
MLKSCLKVEHIFPQPHALHLTLLQPSLSLESNPETPLSKPGISWPLDSHLATTKLFYKERTTSPSPSLEEDTEMDDSTSEVPILGAYYASDRNEEDDMDEEGNTNPNIPAISFQDTMGTNYSFHTLLAQYQEHLLSEQQKLSKVAFRPWEDPRALEEQQWQSRKGKAAAKNPTSKQIQKAQVHHSSALNTAPLTQHIQPSTLPIPPIAFFNNKGQAVGDDVDVDMDDVEVPPDSDEEDQLEDDDLPAGPPSPSSLVQAPYIEPLEAPLNARATAIAKTRAREAYYGRHRKPIIRRDRRSGTRDATRARARQSAGERLKSVKKRLRKAVKNGVPVSYVQPQEQAAAVLYSTTGKRLSANHRGAGVGAGVTSSNVVVGPLRDANGRTVEPMKPSRMIEWVTDLHRLKGEAERGHHNKPRYAENLDAIIAVIEQHETHPDFTIERLAASGLFIVLKDFQHTNKGRGPGLKQFKKRVVDLCARWRQRTNLKEN